MVKITMKQFVYVMLSLLSALAEIHATMWEQAGQDQHCFDGECVSGLKKLKNIGYLGTTYDIFNGNPHVVGSPQDPGFLIGKNLYNFTYNLEETTTDGTYLIPDGTTVNSIDSCSFSFSSAITKSSQSYSDSLKVNVNAQFKYCGASFSASADYQEVTNAASSGEYVYVSSHAQCETYGASIDDAEFSLVFTERVAQLPTSSSSMDDYVSFVEDWGTHVASSMIMGGRYGLRSKFNTTTFNQLSSTKFNFKAAGGYSGVVSINAELATEAERNTANTYDQSSLEKLEYSTGGKPPVSANGTAFDWAATVKDSPIPVSYTLTNIYYYFNKYTFPYDKDIEIKRENVKKALLQYCLKTVPNQALCHLEYGPSDSDRVRVSFSNIVIPSPSLRQTFPYRYQTSYIQYSSDPEIKSFGNILGYSYSMTRSPILMIDTRVVRDTFIGVTLDYVYGKNKIYRPICERNYESLTDLYSTDFNNDFLKRHTFSGIIECVAKECLTQCSASQIPCGDDCVFIGNGNPELGNDGQYGFFRDLSIQLDPFHDSIQELLLCLNYECLQVESI